MPNRVLRDWTQSEIMDSISSKSEVFFTRLIMKVDDFGCFYANIKLLKAALYPLKSISENDIKKCLKECIDVGLVIFYEAESKQYVKINSFNQRLRTMKSKFPQPDGSNSLTIDSKEPPETETKRNRNEIPKVEDFLNYCKDIEEYPFSDYAFSIKSKYEAWVANDWKDGNNNPIKNWKSKIKNALPYMKPTPKKKVGNGMGGFL